MENLITITSREMRDSLREKGFIVMNKYLQMIPDAMLEDIFGREILKAHYLRREGSPNNYKYIYKEPEGREKAKESGKKVSLASHREEKKYLEKEEAEDRKSLIGNVYERNGRKFKVASYNPSKKLYILSSDKTTYEVDHDQLMDLAGRAKRKTA